MLTSRLIKIVRGCVFPSQSQVLTREILLKPTGIASQLTSFIQTSSHCKFPIKTPDNHDDDGFIANMKRQTRWIFSDKYKAMQGGYKLYISCVDCIDLNLFRKKFCLPDSFMSWFLVTALHVWMCSVRVMTDEWLGKTVRNGLLEAMWRDAEVRVDKLGGVPSKVKKETMIALNQHYITSIFSYDEGLLGDDKILAAALWRDFFDSKCNDPELLETLVQYVRMQVSHLDLQSTEAICHQGKPNWLPLKDLDLQA